MSHPDTHIKHKIKLMNTLIRCLHIAYGMVEAAEVQQIEAEIEEFEKEEARSQAEGRIGYKLPDPTS